MQLIESDDESNLLFGGIYQLGVDGLIDQTLTQASRLTTYHPKYLPTFSKGYETTSKVSIDVSSFQNCGALPRCQIFGIIMKFGSPATVNINSLPPSSLPIRVHRSNPQMRAYLIFAVFCT